MVSDHTDETDEDNELDDKMNRLLVMFPQLTRTQLLEVGLGKSRGILTF